MTMKIITFRDQKVYSERDASDTPMYFLPSAPYLLLTQLLLSPFRIVKVWTPGPSVK